MSIDLQEQYIEIKKWCSKMLFRDLHNRHLEDVTQHVAMEAFANSNKFDEFGLKGNWQWYFADYCRGNGLNIANKSKQSARTLELSNFVGDDTFKLEKKTEDSGQDDLLELIDEFLSQLNLNKDAYKWAMKMQGNRL